MIDMAQAVPEKGKMTTSWLQSRFGAPDAPGWSEGIENADGEHTFSRTGAPMVMCWGSAGEVIAELGADRAVTTGYFCRDGSVALMAEHAEGHDLAIVDGRFLVDGWVAHVAGIGPCVLDLLDADDVATAGRLHEAFAEWTVRPEVLEGMDKRLQKEAATPLSTWRYAA